MTAPGQPAIHFYVDDITANLAEIMATIDALATQHDTNKAA